MKATRQVYLAIGLIAASCYGCNHSGDPVQQAQANPAAGAGASATTASDPPRSGPRFDASPYPWLKGSSVDTAKLVALDDRFEPPAGFQRVPVAAESFAAWLRGLPLLSDRTQVLAYNGARLDRPSAAVVSMDVGKRNLMQCADSLIRLHAEYLWSRQRADEAGYRFTSGDLSRWPDWRDGERFHVKGNRVERSRGEPRTNDHRSFRQWLDLVFTYAGTASIARDAAVIPVSEPLRAADFFVDPGFPGHAVILLDIAQDDSGRKVALVGQGFMPAEEIHVLKSPVALEGHWFPLPEAAGEVLDTPSWKAFPRSSARRFP